MLPDDRQVVRTVATTLSQHELQIVLDSREPAPALAKRLWVAVDAIIEARKAAGIVLDPRLGARRLTAGERDEIVASTASDSELARV